MLSEGACYCHSNSMLPKNMNNSLDFPLLAVKESLGVMWSGDTLGQHLGCGSGSPQTQHASQCRVVWLIGGGLGGVTADQCDLKS